MDRTSDQTERYAPEPYPSRMASVVERNIAAMLERRRRDQAAKGTQDRIADAIGRFTGSMRFVYIHAVLFGLWIAINLGWIPFVPRFDESFVVLAMVASVEAIFLSTFVLITQNRMAELADQRADLDLQVSLLAEHEVTRLITLVKAMAERMGVEESRDPELSELERDVAPERVLDEMEAGMRKFAEAEQQPGERPRERPVEGVVRRDDGPAEAR